VAWRQIRAFRNLAVHKYFGVDWAVVWKIAQEEPPVLEKQVLAIISAEYPELAQKYEPGPAPEPGTASLPGPGDAAVATTPSPPAMANASLRRSITPTYHQPPGPGTLAGIPSRTRAGVNEGA
jgi:hypothetical protein